MKFIYSNLVTFAQTVFYTFFYIDALTFTFFIQGTVKKSRLPYRKL